MPISELNNGFLQQCSTVPSASDPDVCVGGTTNQSAGSKHVRRGRKKMQQNQSSSIYNIPLISGTQESILVREDSTNVQRYCMPHFYNDPSKHFTAGLSKNLSTGESGTLKSTVLATNQFRFNP